MAGVRFASHRHGTRELDQICKETGGDHELEAGERPRDAQQAFKFEIENLAQPDRHSSMTEIPRTPDKAGAISAAPPGPGSARKRESRTYGFVRGVRGNSRPYRDSI